PEAGAQGIRQRNRGTINQIRFCQTIQKQSRKGRHRHRSWAGGCTKRARFFCFGDWKENSATDERAGNRTKERKSFSEESSCIATGRKDVCAHWDTAFDDTRGSNGKNRSARRPRHRQREQENRLRPRRRRTGQQVR